MRCGGASCPCSHFHPSASQRRAMAGTASRRGRAFPEEPAGFVFEEASLEGENSPRASALFAAARESAVVLDGAADVKVGVPFYCWTRRHVFARLDRRQRIRKRDGQEGRAT